MGIIPLSIREQFSPYIGGKSPLYRRENSLAAKAFLTKFVLNLNIFYSLHTLTGLQCTTTMDLCYSLHSSLSKDGSQQKWPAVTKIIGCYTTKKMEPEGGWSDGGATFINSLVQTNSL